MASAGGVQVKRRPRVDGTVTYSLRVRLKGIDDTVRLGHSGDGWDEARVEVARRQLVARIELGQWVPPAQQPTPRSPQDEPTFHELATDWLAGRRRNPAIRRRTTELNEWQLSLSRAVLR